MTLENRIESLKEKLNDMLVAANYFINAEIIDLSEQLDELIVLKCRRNLEEYKGRW